MDSQIFIHSSSYVDEGAIVGPGTRIWHFCHIVSSATIGKLCNIGQNVFIGNSVVIGDRVKIQNNVSVYEGVELEDDVFCGPSLVFTNVKNPRSAFPIKQKSEFSKTLIKKGATLGANATIVCGIEIGPWAFIGAGSVVTKNVKAHAMMVGVPARQVGWACYCGQILSKTKNNKTFECSNCQRSFTLFKDQLTMVSDGQ